MSSVDDKNVGNLLITYKFKSTNPIDKVEEERKLKHKISKLLACEGYQFVIADDAYISAKLLGNIKEL